MDVIGFVVGILGTLLGVVFYVLSLRSQRRGEIKRLAWNFLECWRVCGGSVGSMNDYVPAHNRLWAALDAMKAAKHPLVDKAEAIYQIRSIPVGVLMPRVEEFEQAVLALKD